MNLTIDTTFFSIHYFSHRSEELSKTRRVLTECRKLGSRGTVPTIVLGEFYSLAHRAAGREVAEKSYREITDSGLHLLNLDAQVSKQAGVLRRKYQEKAPWGDCIIAATALHVASDFILSEDPHFKMFREMRSRTLTEVVS